MGITTNMGDYAIHDDGKWIVFIRLTNVDHIKVYVPGQTEADFVIKQLDDHNSSLNEFIERVDDLSIQEIDDMIERNKARIDDPELQSFSSYDISFCRDLLGQILEHFYAKLAWRYIENE